jgi:aspartate/methionine/tyrosine aminotransferase
MRRSLVHEGATRLSYEIREIVPVAKSLGKEVIWENIGDPIQKGEPFPSWMKEIIAEMAMDSSSYAYCDTQGLDNTRSFLADLTNKKGGAQITPDDIMFFNGLGDAVAKVFGFLKREARVIGPSPAYSTFSSAEAAHSGYEHLSYKLDPEKGWAPDLEDIENKVKYNDAVAGILVINPDNPTGVVYSCDVLKGIIDIARRYHLFVVFDETYGNIVFNGGETCFLSEVIGDVPGISMRSISKEYPWPGGRCGWIEVYNKNKTEDFSLYIDSLLAAKRLEVCSTTLPQLTIPTIMGDPRYEDHLNKRALMFGSRAQEIYSALSSINEIEVHLPQGALYFPVLFKKGVLTNAQSLVIEDEGTRKRIEKMCEGVAPDKRFVYYLLAHTGICVVPLSSFHSDLYGFRMTLLEYDDEKRKGMIAKLSKAIKDYLAS